MENSHTITFHPNGTATTLYTDKLPLRELGTLAVERASRIEFNDTTQEWEVRFVHDERPSHLDVSGAVGMPKRVYSESPVRFSHPSREECLKWEHDRLANDRVDGEADEVAGAEQGTAQHQREQLNR